MFNILRRSGCKEKNVNSRVEAYTLEVELKPQVLHVSGASYFILVFDKILFEAQNIKSMVNPHGFDSVSMCKVPIL